MGVRKHNTAERRKEDRKTLFIAKLNNCPTSPRKMRLVADLVRGKNVEFAINILKYTEKEAAGRLYKLVLSAVSNWQKKNEGVRMEESNLYIKTVMVDSARQLKRIRPAPQGRAHRIRKRSNHITLVLDSRTKKVVEAE
jgi:large subunit ribosomal protein L22